MMDTVMTRPWRFTLAQFHVAASLLSPRSAVSARHLLQQPHVPRVLTTCPAPCHAILPRLQPSIQVMLNVRKE